FRIDLFDDTILILKRPIGNLDCLADLEGNLRLHLFLALLHLRQHRFDLRWSHRNRLILGAGKSNYSGRVFDEIPGAIDQLIVLVEQMHVHDEVAREKFSRSLALLSLLNLGDALGWDKYLID